MSPKLPDISLEISRNFLEKKLKKKKLMKNSASWNFTKFHEKFPEKKQQKNYIYSKFISPKFPEIPHEISRKKNLNKINLWKILLPEISRKSTRNITKIKQIKYLVVLKFSFVKSPDFSYEISRKKNILNFSEILLNLSIFHMKFLEKETTSVIWKIHRKDVDF